MGARVSATGGSGAASAKAIACSVSSAGVAATGVVVARRRRAQRSYDPDELRERLHQRLAETERGGEDAPPRSA